MVGNVKPRKPRIFCTKFTMIVNGYDIRCVYSKPRPSKKLNSGEFKLGTSGDGNAGKDGNPGMGALASNVLREYPLNTAVTCGIGKFVGIIVDCNPASEGMDGIVGRPGSCNLLTT